MASLAQDRISGPAGPGKAARTPLSAHPAFPFIVALWFAALLGIGSLVVPVPVIERLVELTGLSSVVPQTAPPLGFTARALIALACTAGGGLFGLLLARKVAQAHRAPAPRKDRGQAAARRPISAHDELGEEGFDGNAPRGRRALAIVDEEAPSEVFELAPLPGKHLPLSALDLDEAEALELAEADAFDLADETAEAVTDEPGDLPAPGFTTLAESAQNDVFSMADRRHFKLDTFGQTVGAPIQPRQQFVLDPAAPAETQEPMPEEVDATPEPEADLHFSPPSLARPFAQPAFSPAEPPAETAAEIEDADMDDFAEQAPHAAVPNAPAQPATGWEQAEPEDLALVQLAQRLGSSIARRREQRAAAAAAAAAAAKLAPVPAPAPAMLAEDFDAAEAAEAAQAMAAYFGSAGTAAAPAPQPADEPEAMDEPAVVTPLVPPSPAAATLPAARQVFQPVAPAPVAPQPASLANLAHIDLGEDEEDEDIAHLTASFSLPLVGPAAAVAPPIQVEDEAEEIVVPAPAPAPFANPFQQRPAQSFVRIEDEPQPEEGAIEPAVVFPGAGREDAATSSRASAEENERALREALLSLQRMSGAA
ncbi:hypothetical protein [Alteraurantiacibacter buctensis]|uniref:Uncharacterized protein n=1 Tax=Alteraurantiacibacter buctensis TaxID=1503981 RepID=A0A844YX89_9SPHN|nr:hypothetical protein [Alteraurantiacibacter buctensis]MXO70353.1 hypothetical protein [Alteraurantiacibacter buctensis]